MKNTFWIAGSTIIMKVIRAAIIIYAARLLGTDDYGVFTYAMSLAGIFAIFSDMGISSILTRELAKGRSDDKEYLSTSIVVKFGFILFVILAISLLGPVVSKFDEASSLMAILAFSIAFEGTRNFLYSITRAKNNMQAEAGLGIVTEIICTALVVAVFFRDPTPQSLALSYMIGNGIGLFITTVSFRKHFVGAMSYVKKSLIMPILRASLPFTIMGVFGILMTNIDSIIIGHFSDEHTLGLYGAAQRPISILYIIPGFLTVSFLPIISKFAAGAQDRMGQLIRKTMLLALGIGLPIAAGGIIIARPFINAAFGFEYVGAALTLQILLVSLLFSFPAAMLSDVMLAENKQKILVKASIFGAITNVVLDILLIPRFGIAGSAVATVITQIVFSGIFFIEAKRTHRFHITGGLWRIIISTGVTSVLTLLLVSVSLPLLLIVPVAGLCYIALLLLFREPLIKDVLSSFGA